jgi:hypothetical protein
MTNETALEALRTQGQAILVWPANTRGRALEIRRAAKESGLKVRLRKSTARVIVLERWS